MISTTNNNQARGAQPLGATGWAKAPVRDASGYAVFSHGDVGSVHVMAHRLFDAGRIEEGHRRLGAWLKGHSGSGSEWVHLHFHMALFELELGYWGAAYYRFCEHILPTAASTDEALTDAPALLWRLSLTAPEHVELPWQSLRDTALRNLGQSGDCFVELHHLLALAGAGDTGALEAWLADRAATGHHGEHVVRRLAMALRAYVGGAFHQAAQLLESLLPRVGDVGGSQAQNALFADIASSSWRNLNASYAQAA